MAWNREKFHKLTTPRLVKKFMPYVVIIIFYFPFSQQLTPCPYPEPDQSITSSTALFASRSILIIFSQIRLGFTSGVFPTGLSTKRLCTFLSPPYAPHDPTISKSFSPYLYLLCEYNTKADISN